MRSVNANDGTTTLEVSFDVGTNLDNANMLTQNLWHRHHHSCHRSNKRLPQKGTHLPLMLISLSSPNGTYDSKFLNNYAFINVVDELKRLNGLGDVYVFGGSEYAMRFWVKPDLLSKYNLTMQDVVMH
jgi:HAE1 family hydrophobic/amphiphilic exporter-1